jgi:uncharacterized membrane protein
MVRNIKGLIYKPFNLLYMAFLFFVLFTVASWFLSFFRGLMVQTLGIPQEYFWAVVLLSLMGSYVNLPIVVLESEQPVAYKEEVDAFGVTWMIPEVDAGPRQTLIMINMGRGIIPALISLYLLVFSILACLPDPLMTYLKALVVLVVVTLSTHQSAQIVEGLGITNPAWGPPTMTAFVVMLVNHLSSVTCPAQIAYVGGTLGALIGADLMNLHKIAGVGPVVSIGGAGTFDGVYITGIVSVLLILFLA